MSVYKSLIFFSLLVLFIFSGISSSAKTLPSGEPVFIQEFLGQIEFVEGRLTQLAEAVPQDKYGWRPAEGVRSVGEVYIHVAFGNYLWIKLGGGTVPDEVGFDPSKMKEWDTQTTDKNKIIEIMKKSFDALKEFAKGITEENLEKEVEFFGMKSSMRNFLISVIGHCHEHLGQSIAYARMNGVTPPWSKNESGQ